MFNIDLIAGEVSKEIDIPENIVISVYKAYWKTIRDIILELPLKLDITIEEFNTLRTNFNIPSLGKLCCTLERFLAMKQRFNHIKTIKKNVQNYKNKTS